MRAADIRSRAAARAGHARPVTAAGRPALDDALRRCADALDGPRYAHLLGVVVDVGGSTRAVGRGLGTASNLFSATKTVVAAAVHVAAREGVVDLDAPLAVAPVATARRLLTMTQAWAADPDMDAVELRTDDPLPDLVGALAPGGAGPRYVNAATHLLTRELYARTGSAHAYVADRVLAPAGVATALWERDPVGVPWGHAHLHLTVEELARLGRHLLDAGLVPLLSAGAGAPVPPEGLPYGSGAWAAAGSVPADGSVTADGSVLAAGWGGQCLLLLPAADAVVAVLGATGWDRRAGTDTLAPGWGSGRSLVEATLLPSLTPR